LFLSNCSGVLDGEPFLSADQNIIMNCIMCCFDGVRS